MRTKFGLSSRIPILADTMANSFDEKFAVWPERSPLCNRSWSDLVYLLIVCRYYTIHNGHMAYVAEPTHEFGYDRDQLLRSIMSLDNTVKYQREAQRKQQTEIISTTT